MFPSISDTPSLPSPKCYLKFHTVMTNESTRTDFMPQLWQNNVSYHFAHLSHLQQTKLLRNGDHMVFGQVVEVVTKVETSGGMPAEEDTSGCT